MLICNAVYVCMQVLCTKWTDAEYRAERCSPQEWNRRYTQHGVDRVWRWAQLSQFLPYLQDTAAEDTKLQLYHCQPATPCLHLFSARVQNVPLLQPPLDTVFWQHNMSTMLSTHCSAAATAAGTMCCPVASTSGTVSWPPRS